MTYPGGYAPQDGDRGVGWAPAQVPQQHAQEEPSTPSRRGRLVLAIVLLVAGLAGVGGGAAVASVEMTRHATQAEAAAAGQQEAATLWERLTAGQIFPRQLSYVSALGYGKANLIGVAPSSSCAAATDPDVATVLRSAGCVAMLRATYTDSTGTVATTVGVAVFGSARAAAGASSAIAGYTVPQSPLAGLDTLSFPGTSTSNFTDRAREAIDSQAHGSYLIMYAAGFADGRTTSPDSGASDDAPQYLAASVERAVSKILTAPSKPCESRFVSC